MHCSEKLLCIKCNGDGNLLVCADNDCPLAMHKECMGCPARFDDEGRFYCPYCWYRQSAAESRRAREYALSRKEALTIFMDDEIIPTSEHLENDKRDKDNGCDGLDKGAGNANLEECDGGTTRQTDDDGLDKGTGNANLEECDGGTTRQNDNDIVKQSIPPVEEHETGGTEEESTQEDESEAFEDQTPIVGQEENNEDTEETNIKEDDPSQPSNAGEKMIQEDPSHVDEQEDEEKEDSVQEVHETPNVSADAKPSQSVPARGKRGSKRKGSTDTGSKPIKPKDKEAQRSEKRTKKSLSATPARRSSRRLSSTPVEVTMSNEKKGGLRKNNSPR